MNREDRRVRRTRKLLADALFELLSEKEYDDITVQEIADRADVGHRTFYRHYDNIDDLMLAVVEGRLQEFQERMIPPDSEIAPETNGTLLFSYVLENQHLFAVLFQSISVERLKPVLRERAARATDEMFSMMDDTLMADVVVNHIVSSILSLIRWWLDNNFPYSPEEMGQIYADLIIRSTRQYLASTETS